MQFLNADSPPQTPSTASDQVGCLLRRAIVCLDTDRETARRCLQQASILLEPRSQDAEADVSSGLAVLRSGGLARWQAKRALTYIEAHLGSSMDVRTLANVVAISKSHFARAFKRSLGVPPMAYVTTRRVEYAKLMMISTKHRLTDIATASGFADQAHLNRWFRRIVGASPGQWRRATMLADGCARGRAHAVAATMGSSLQLDGDTIRR